MRNVVPRTPATAFSVSIWNFCSPWITEVTFAQSLPKNNLALNLRLAAPPKCASASWTFALGPRRSTELSPKRTSSRAPCWVSRVSPWPTEVPTRSSVLGPFPRHLCALPSSAETCAVFGCAASAGASRATTKAPHFTGPARGRRCSRSVRSRGPKTSPASSLHFLRELLGAALQRHVQLLGARREAAL